jgi:hypothetical protein
MLRKLGFLRDILFQLRLFRGTKVASPDNLCLCIIAKEGDFTTTYRLELNLEHPLALWLLEECEGPWAIRLVRPYYRRKSYVAFARPADAVLFRLIQ